MNKEKIGSTLLDWGLILFACSLPWSNFGMSISYFLLLGGLIFTPLKRKSFNLSVHSPGLSLIGVFFIFLIPVLYTQHLKEAIHDLNIKLPCLLVGLVFFYQKEIISKLRNYEKYFGLFSLSCLLAVSFSFLYFFYLDNHGIHDSRKASPFISHIRLSLMAAIAVLFFLNKIYLEGRKKMAYLLPAIFLTFAVIYLGWVNGILAIFIVILVVAGFYVFPFTQTKAKALGFFWVLAISFTALEYFRLGALFGVGPLPSSLPAETINHRKYFHDTLLKFSENGNRYGLYYQPEEFKAAWEKRSAIKTTDNDAKGNQIQYTCFRYLTSKGLGKDSMGVWQLTQQDINNIESGIPNYQLLNLMPFERRIYDFFVEWQSMGSIQSMNGHTFRMRIIYWKSGIQLIKENFLLGLGTGNVPDELKAYHEKKNKPLAMEFRNRSHNQYITTFLNSGIIGFTLFLLFLIIPWWVTKPANPIMLGSWLVLLFSMISEDTLETQAGVGIFIWIMILPSLVHPDAKPPHTISGKPQQPFSS